MTETYRAIRLERFAESFRAAAHIAELPVAAPGPGEIRVRNHWCGVNGIFDTQLARDAVDYIRVTLPTLTGVEAIGIVDAVGDGVTGVAVGDAVANMRFRGGYREVNVAPADQFAKSRDCRVVAICGGADKVAFVERLGADRVIDYRQESVSDVLANEFADALDVAVDTVGGGIFDAFVDNLAPHGRLVISGAARDMDKAADAGDGPRIALRIYYKAARIQAFQNGLVQHLWPAARERLFALQKAGKLVVHCDANFVGLSAAYDAVEHLLSGQSLGKVVVDLRPQS